MKLLLRLPMLPQRRQITTLPCRRRNPKKPLLSDLFARSSSRQLCSAGTKPGMAISAAPSTTNWAFRSHALGPAAKSYASTLCIADRTVVYYLIFLDCWALGLRSVSAEHVPYVFGSPVLGHVRNRFSIESPMRANTASTSLPSLTGRCAI